MACTLRIIAALSDNRVIGRGGELPWRIPGDMARFKALTMGHPVVMGRKTFESLGCRPLPGRENVVLTRNTAYRAEGCRTAPEWGEALSPYIEGEEVFVIGGGEVFRGALPLAEVLSLTLVHLETSGDTFFPDLPPGAFVEVARRAGEGLPPHTFVELVRSGRRG